MARTRAGSKSEARVEERRTHKTQAARCWYRENKPTGKDKLESFKGKLQRR